MEVQHEVPTDQALKAEEEENTPPSEHVMGLMLQQNEGEVMNISPEMAVMEVGEAGLNGQDEDGDDAQQQQQDLLASDGQVTTSQLVTLADGQQVQALSVTLPDDAKMYEGQTIQLEDGTTAIVQNVMPEEQETEEQPQIVNNQLPKLVEGQAIQLEDGTIAYIQNTNKDGLQAVQLEDGTTAYITCAGAETLFSDGAQLEATQLTLEQLNQQALAGATGGQVRVGSERAMSMSEKAFRCQYDGCGRLYTTQHHLKVHERSHTGDRPFKCTHPGCRKAFATGYGLKSHVRVHTGEKPYRCPEQVCDKAFKTSGDLQKHVRTHTGERPFKCPFEGCERSFTTSNIRKVHIRTHTGERPYICDEDGCNKAFSSATNYKNHIRIHTGEKPYVCTVEDCGKRFTEYSSLYKHHVVHTHSKPYMCNHCGKNYRQTSTLSMHKRTAHGDDSVLDPETALLLPPSLNPHNDISTLHPPLPITGSPGFKRVNVQLPGGLVGGLPAAAGEGAMEEDEGALVINTSDAPQVTMMTDNTVIGGFSQEAAQATLQQLTSGQGITLADGDGQQHIYVVTDPAQLEALQQLAQQQLFANTPTTTTTTTGEGAVIATDEAASSE